MTEQKKIRWVTTHELNSMMNSARVLEHECPYCDEDWTYGMTNGEVFDITTNYIEIQCPYCKETYDVSWEGDPDFERTEDDFLDF